MSEVTFGTCKICGGTTYSMGGDYLCKNFNCPAWYKPQNAFVYVRLNNGQEGYCRKDKLPEGAKVMQDAD